LLVTTVVDAMRNLKFVHPDLSYEQIASRFVPSNDELLEVAQDLDRHAAEEVDAELQRLRDVAEEAFLAPARTEDAE